MGVHPKIGADRFPKQGAYLNMPCTVCFDYDTSKQFRGRVIRDDAEEPGHCIIQLDDGRVVLTTECQWQPLSLAVVQGHA